MHGEFLQLRSESAFNPSVVLLKDAEPDSQGRRFQKLDSRYNSEMIEWINSANAECAKRYKYLDSRSFPVFVCYRDSENEIQEEGYQHGIAMQKGLNRFRNLYCHAGLNMLSIKADGRVSGATCGVLSNLNINMISDNPYEHDEFNRVVVCPYTSCGCVSDVYLPKYRSKEDAPQYVARFPSRHVHQSQDAPGLAHRLLSGLHSWNPFRRH